jgi:hypothetical protein
MKIQETSRLIALTLFALFSPLALAVDVRGRIDYVFPNGFAPMARASVQLCYIGGSCTPVYVTGPDGMYYFQASPGPHAVLVNGVERYRLQIANTFGFDIPPIRGN